MNLVDGFIGLRSLSMKLRAYEDRDIIYNNNSTIIILVQSTNHTVMRYC